MVLSNIENKLICLTLNSSWLPIGYNTVGHAISNLCCTDEFNKPTFFALDITYPNDEDTYSFDDPSSIKPVSWDEWITLPVREFDLSISTPSLKIRVPTVVIASRFSKMPVKTFKLNRDSIRKRDNDTCQYTGKRLKPDEGSVDHIVPKKYGGGATWNNLVYCAREINRKKGSNHNKDVGLRLIKEPKEPVPVPACMVLKDIKHRDWKHFVIKNVK